VTASISPPNDPSKNWPAADRPAAALGHTGVKHPSAIMLLALPPHPQCVRGPPMMTFASAGDVVPPPSLVVPSLGITNNESGKMAAAAASVSQLVSLFISLFSRSSCRLCIALCISSDNWELSWPLGAQRPRTFTLLTQWRPMQRHFITASGARKILVRLILWLRSLQHHKPDATD